jgi:hypothetical protein
MYIECFLFSSHTIKKKAQWRKPEKENVPKILSAV